MRDEIIPKLRAGTRGCFVLYLLTIAMESITQETDVPRLIQKVGAEKPRRRRVRSKG
jgi:hypothetical protein